MGKLEKLKSIFFKYPKQADPAVMSMMPLAVGDASFSLTSLNKSIPKMSDTKVFEKPLGNSRQAKEQYSCCRIGE